MEKFCGQCKTLNQTAINNVKEEYTVKGETVVIESEIRYCTNCGKELWDNDLDGLNVKKAYEAYKHLKGLLSSEEIKRIRIKYGLSQSSFAKLLGFGEKTITRYENGTIQEKAQDNLIRLMDDMKSFEKIWKLSKNELEQREINKVEETLYSLKVKESEILGWVIHYPTTSEYKVRCSI